MPNAGGDCNRKTKECAKFRKRNIFGGFGTSFGQIPPKIAGLRPPTTIRGNAAVSAGLQIPVTNAI
jgi:hypothetical protein